MTRTLKLIAVGNSTGLIVPKEVLARLRVEQGNSLFLVETASGFELRAYDPDFDEQVELAEQVMRENRDVLRKLGR